MSVFNTFTQAVKDVPTLYKIAWNVEVCKQATSKEEIAEAVQRIKDASVKAGMTPDKKEENFKRMKNAKNVAKAGATVVTFGIIGAIFS